MELKTFKTYLNEQEQLDEFLGAALGLATRVAPRIFGALGKRGLKQAVVSGAVEAGANKLLGNNNTGTATDTGIPYDIEPSSMPVVAPRTAVNTRNMTSSSGAPRPVDSLNPNTRQPVQFSGSFNPITNQLMYGGLRAKLGRI